MTRRLLLLLAVLAVPALCVAAPPVAVAKQGGLTTTAVTADQVVLSHTVTTGKKFYLGWVNIEGTLTAASAAAAALGDVSIELPSGTKITLNRLVNPTTSAPDRVSYTFTGEQFVLSGGVIRVVCTPAAITSTRWNASFGGFEK